MSKAQWIKENLKEGEVYAGLILGKDGAPDHHLILLPGETEAPFKEAENWAKKAGGSLPTRREQSLLFANCKEEFKTAWYWSCETHSADPAYAWYQHFGNGTQLTYHKSHELRARAVRRILIEE